MFLGLVTPGGILKTEEQRILRISTGRLSRFVRQDGCLEKFPASLSVYSVTIVSFIATTSFVVIASSSEIPSFLYTLIPFKTLIAACT